jgi:zinc protease
MRTTCFRFGALCVVAAFAFNLSAQQFQPLPIDPKVRYGKLDNGLTYYIRANKEPKQRADFYIAQNVGAILENDNQNGLAHFLEHMAFNGTKHYPGKGILNYLESIGVKFGADINAHTGLDETVYNLSDVPTVRDGIIDSSLLVLHDWSGFISLEGSEIDAERGVIREEWRTGAGADRRMWKESNKQKYPGSQYSKRDVIGDTAIINNFKYKTIRDFYQKWYHPDLQAIMVVGDVDVDKVEAKIKTLFADISKNPNAGLRPVYPILDNGTPIVSIVKDAEARMTRIELEYKHDKLPAEVKLSIQGYGISTVNSLISTMIGNRFEEITQQADAPFVGAYAFYGELVKSKDAFQLLAVPKEGKELDGLNALLLEAEKIKRFGFTNSELERAKADMLKNVEKAYNERDNQKNNSLIEEYVRNFLNQEVIPGIEWEYNTMKAMLPQMKLDIINQMAKSYVTDTNLIVSVMAPDKEAVKIPSKDQILAAVVNAKKAELKARAEENINQPLIKKAPQTGRIQKTTENKALGTTEWTLSNGVKVILKPTTFKKDEILLNAFSDGGLSKVKNVADLPSAMLATAIESNNGLGEFTLVDLNKILTGKIASVNPSIGAYDEGFSGNSSVSDFETLLQLVYLHFTAPRKDDNSFKAMMNAYRASLANSASDPRKAFSDSIGMTLSNHHSRTVLMNLKTLDLVDQDKALAIYKERFAVPADFTFIFTGNVDPANEAFKAAVCTYLGGLKSKKGGEKFTDNNIRRPKGKVTNDFTKEMKVKKASNFILYSAAMPFNITNRTVLTAIGSILDLRYTESIREKEGGSYGVGVRGSLNNTPIEEASLMMQFDTDPAKQAKLLAMIHSEVDEIVANGPRPDDLQKVKENMLKKYTEDLAENGWWSGAMERFYHNKINLVTDYKASVEALTPALIQSTLKNIVSQGNVMEVVMKPAE